MALSDFDIDLGTCSAAVTNAQVQNGMAFFLTTLTLAALINRRQGLGVGDLFAHGHVVLGRIPGAQPVSSTGGKRRCRAYVCHIHLNSFVWSAPCVRPSIQVICRTASNLIETHPMCAPSLIERRLIFRC